MGTYKAYSPEFKDDKGEWRMIPTKDGLPPGVGVPHAYSYRNLNKEMHLYSKSQAACLAWMFKAGAEASGDLITMLFAEKMEIRLQEYEVEYALSSKKTEAIVLPEIKVSTP
jgi:hypothetical protein